MGGGGGLLKKWSLLERGIEYNFNSIEGAR